MNLRRIAGVFMISSLLAATGVAADHTSAQAEWSDELGVPEPDSSGSDESGEGTFGPQGSARPQATTTKPRTTIVSASAYGLHDIVPVRLFDSRPAGRLARASETPIAIAGVAGVPSSATAAVVNITVTGSSEGGFVTVSPCGAAYGTSNVNFAKGQTIANLAVVGLGTGGAICVTPSVDAEIIVDLSGYVAPGGQLYSPVTPTRVLDTRPTGARLAAGVPHTVALGGVAGIPATGAQAAAVNITITDPAAEGYATAYPCGGTAPLASNVNFAKGQTAAANGVVVGLDAASSLCVVSSVTADLIVDVTGWFGTTGTEVRPAAPTRLWDTRQGNTRQAANKPLRVPSAPGALGTVVNITVTGSDKAGYATVWPCDSAMPETSALNFAKGQTIANALLAAVNTSGLICVATSVDAHIIVDRTAVLGLAGSGNLESTGSVVTDWALTQVGSTYVAMNPYRFGDSKYGKAWDCAPGETVCSRVDTQGKTRTVAPGSYVYDCSGLVVAAWLQAGIDLVKAGASWTEPMLQKLPAVERSAAQVGDLLLFDFDATDTDPVSHVGLYLSDTEMVHAGTCKGGTSAVCRTAINWANVAGIRRPPGA